MVDYQQKYEKLLEEHKEVIDKCMNNNNRLWAWNESLTKTVGYISIFIFCVVLLLIRPDILILIINSFQGCVK